MNLKPKFCSNRNLKSFIFSFMMLLVGAVLYAQPGIHDPSTTIKNTDGRYWHFATGNGIYTISSATTDFSSWQAENTVFPVGTWPSWIASYVTNFQGNFWAPEVVKIGSTYYCYYSCAGDGAAAAIGLATATNLSGPWTDKGMIVAGNNCIDPAILIDGTNMYMTYGNWQSGIDMIQLNATTGLRLNTNRWDLVAGQVEGPGIMKRNSYYYLFFQRGLCCNGVNSGYYMQVGRATSPTGPYYDQNGIDLMNTGGTTFLPNKNGRYIGPGHFGYGESTLSYHFYDGNDNGAPKLMTTTLGWSNDWPVAGTASQIVPNGTYRLVNRASGKYMDNLGATTDGANIGQYSSSSSNNQKWVITYDGNGYYKLKCSTGGKYLDSVNATADGSNVGQWSNSTNFNQYWTITSAGPYYKLTNRSNGKCIDTGGLTANGSILQFWYSNTSTNQQWTLEFVSSSTSKMSNNIQEDNDVAINEDTFFATPNPVKDGMFRLVSHNPSVSDVSISIVNIAGQVVYVENLPQQPAGLFTYTINASQLAAGMYIVNMVSCGVGKSLKLVRN